MMKEAAEFRLTPVAAAFVATVPAAGTWDETVRTHRASIYRLAYRLTGNSHDAEDLTQDVFVNILLSPSAFSPSVSASRLHHVTKALYRDQLVLRRHGVRQGSLGEDTGHRLPISTATSSSVARHRQCDAPHARDTAVVT
jgi:DNA-directed RNA polymerase specialized sigma24 family protein